MSEEKLFRGFVWSSKAWYAEGARIKNGEICLGIYSSHGGAVGEMLIEWEELAGRMVPKLEAFNDSWKVLAGFTDVLEALSRFNDDENVSEEDVIKVLLECGFTDKTDYTRPADY
jgi:hypothetical protein